MELDANDLRAARKIAPAIVDCMLALQDALPQRRFSYIEKAAVEKVKALLFERWECVLRERRFELEQEIAEAQRALDVANMDIFAMHYTEAMLELDDIVSESSA